MIRLRLNEKILEHSVTIGRRLEIGELADATGIHRTTLSKMLNRPDYNCTTSNLDLICKFFDCPLSDIAVYEPDSNNDSSSRSFKGPRGKRVAKSTE